jgi:hypothetical protein
MKAELPEDEEDIREVVYKNTLTLARKYFEICRDSSIIPEHGLQKVVYDLGKNVNTFKEGDLRRQIREALKYLNI